MSNSSWSETRAKSQYHFDKTVMDPRWDTVHHLGRFIGDWTQELDQAYRHGRATTWASRAPNGIPPEVLAKEEYDLEQQGYGRDYVITDIAWNISPVFQSIADCFALEDVMVRVHIQWPGQCWNLHIDKLEKWCPDDPNQVVRYFIALTDWEMGHFWNYGNYMHSHWKSGDIFTFDWQNVPHSTANAGHLPRATLQVTGVRTKQTTLFLDQLEKEHTYSL